MIYWMFLGLAIITEVIGTLSMKYASVSGDSAGMIVMYIMIASSYILLSMAVKKVALGVAYALWEGIGILIITTFRAAALPSPASAVRQYRYGRPSAR